MTSLPLHMGVPQLAELTVYDPAAAAAGHPWMVSTHGPMTEHEALTHLAVHYGARQMNASQALDLARVRDITTAADRVRVTREAEDYRVDAALAGSREQALRVLVRWYRLPAQRAEQLLADA